MRPAIVNQFKAGLRGLQAASTGTHDYPFSKVATIVRDPTAQPTQSLKNGKGLMVHVRQQLIPPDKRPWLKTLFARNHPQRLLPGSIVNITQTHAPSNFTGVL